MDKDKRIQELEAVLEKREEIIRYMAHEIAAARRAVGVDECYPRTIEGVIAEFKAKINLR